MGYTVKSKEKDIAISDYPLLQTEFLYASKTGKAEVTLGFLMVKSNHFQIIFKRFAYLVQRFQHL